MEHIRPDLTPMPARIARLPVDPTRGWPIPKFVAWVDGVPEFRAMDPKFWVRAVKEKRCWICSDPMGVWQTFVVGPMCGLNRTTSEPPCHDECAQWSAQNCPFLSRPYMLRREAEWTVAARENTAGLLLDRNPGVTLLWTTRGYRVFDDGRGRPLIEMGPPFRVAWICEGRNATREEVVASVDSGLPALIEACEQELTALKRRDAREELDRRHRGLVELYPPEAA